MFERFRKTREAESEPVTRLLPAAVLPPKRETRELAAPRGAKRKGKTRFYSVGEGADFLGWNPSNVSADTAIYKNLTLHKARCRDLARNNDYVRHFLRLLRSNVVGPRGFRFQGKLRSGGQRDRDFNRTLEIQWNAAGKLKHAPSVCGRMTRRDMANLWMTTLAVDGEVIVIQHPFHDGNRYRFASQLLDPALLDWQKNEDLGGGRRIKMGVEVDAFDRPVAYHFLNHHPGDMMWYSRTSAPRHTRVPAERVHHTFMIETPGQTRGVSWLASPAVRSHMLMRFEEAIVIGSRVAASKMGFYKPNEDFTGVGLGEDVEDDEEGTDNFPELEPGMMEQLPRGIDVETFDPNYPPANLEEFEKKLLKGIASGLGIDYVSMANDLEGVNYSSIRAGQLEQREIYRALQQFFIEHFEEPTFDMWARVQTMNPDVSIDGRKLQSLLDGDHYRFLGRGWSWVDPLKEVKAYREALDGRMTSLRRVVAETQGEDLEDLVDEIEEDEKLLAEKGLQRIPAKAPAAAPSPEETPPSDEES